MKKIDWLEYLKMEGLYDTASPTVQECLETVRFRQKEVDGLGQMLQEAGMTNMSHCPVGFAVECSTRIGQNCNADTELVFHTLMDVIRKLQDRISLLESKLK